MKVILYLLMGFMLIALFGCKNSEKKLIEQGNDLVEKIEIFKTNIGRLPADLEELGINETLEGPLFYNKLDSANYMVWFGTSLGESMIYYSDTKEWDYRLRGMGKEK
jgi:hypothetical protein